MRAMLMARHTPRTRVVSEKERDGQLGMEMMGLRVECTAKSLYIWSHSFLLYLAWPSKHMDFFKEADP
jgi:hypothetical protein